MGHGLPPDHWGSHMTLTTTACMQDMENAHPHCGGQCVPCGSAAAVAMHVSVRLGGWENNQNHTRLPHSSFFPRSNPDHLAP